MSPIVVLADSRESIVVLRTSCWNGFSARAASSSSFFSKSSGQAAAKAAVLLEGGGMKGLALSNHANSPARLFRDMRCGTWPLQLLRVLCDVAGVAIEAGSLKVVEFEVCMF